MGEAEAETREDDRDQRPPPSASRTPCHLARHRRVRYTRVSTIASRAPGERSRLQSRIVRLLSLARATGSGA